MTDAPTLSPATVHLDGRALFEAVRPPTTGPAGPAGDSGAADPTTDRKQAPTVLTTLKALLAKAGKLDATLSIEDRTVRLGTHPGNLNITASTTGVVVDLELEEQAA